MACADCSASALRLHQVVEPEETADIIDDLVAKVLTQPATTAMECLAIIDLLSSSLELDKQARDDGADLTALRSIRQFVATKCQ